MTTQTPFDWVTACAVAWPFVSDYARAQRLVELPSPSNKKLWEAARDEVHATTRSRSLHEVELILKSVYGGSAENARPFAHMLGERARALLRVDGSHVVLDGRPEEWPRQVQRWRWLSLALPADLLCATMGPHVSEVCDPLLASPQLSRLLDRGVAETHLHLKAGTSFEDIWHAHMLRPPTAALRKKERLATELLQAAISRLVLGRYLAFKDARVVPASFEAWTTAQTPKDSLYAALRGRPNLPRIDVDLHERVFRCLQALERGHLGKASVTALSDLHARLSGSYGDTERQDPLGAAFTLDGQGSPEKAFLGRGMQFGAAEDPHFASLFWQYVRVRCRLFRELTQEPGTMGLDWFYRHFEQLEGVTVPGLGKRLEHAVRHAGRGAKLTFLEARVGPAKDGPELRRDMLDWVRAANHVSTERDQGCETGLIIHFLKTTREPGTPAARANAGVRYGAWARKTHDEARVIEEFLARWPQAAHFLRGVDVANAELALPTWVTLPLLSLAHRPFGATARGLRGLQATCHVGEEFRTLHEGLRRIDEVVSFGKMRAGDRLGHCVALGLDPERWLAKHREVLVPLEERLWDLVWECELYEGSLPDSAGRYAGARREAEEFGSCMFDKSVSLRELSAVRGLLHDPAWLRRQEYPRHVRRTNAVGVELLALRILTDAGVYQRGQEELLPVSWKTADITFLCAAREWLCDRIARMEITIEANPSSNLLIANLPGFEAHPLHTFGAVRVSINSDDPVTFATKLADEYVYIFASLLEAGKSHEEALQYIDRARETGLASRFTVPQSQDAAVSEALHRAFTGRGIKEAEAIEGFMRRSV